MIVVRAAKFALDADAGEMGSEGIQVGAGDSDVVDLEIGRVGCEGRKQNGRQKKKCAGKSHQLILHFCVGGAGKGFIGAVSANRRLKQERSSLHSGECGLGLL